MSATGRFDSQRFVYGRWEGNPLLHSDLAPEEAGTELARRFFRWTGPASLAHFQWFSGFGVRAAKVAVDPLGLVPIQPESDLLLSPEELESLYSFQPSDAPAYALVGSLDPLLLNRRDLRSLVDEEDFGDLNAGDGLQDLPSNAIFDRGRLVGLWEFDPEAKEIVWATFKPADEALRSEIARTEAFVRDDLGDARSHSMDTPAGRRPRIEALRAKMG
jgi:hypothetical protein